MKTSENSLPGDSPAFKNPLHVAQVNLPPWEQLESSFRGIFARQYFANNGPLVRELDTAIADTLGVNYAVCVTNGTLAIALLARALELTGDVIVPAFTFPATVQGLLWAGLNPVYCDVDPDTHMLTAALVEPLIDSKTVAVMGVNLWGKVGDISNLETLCSQHGLALIFDSCHAFACGHGKCMVGGAGRGEAFSFHATKVLNAAEGGCITTNDPEMAARLKTMRCFHPSETFATVPLRFNAKMSEAQAALALLSLEQLDANIHANKSRYQAYVSGLKGMPGIRLVEPAEPGNYQYIVICIDRHDFGLSRDALMYVLAGENILCRRHFYPGAHQVVPAKGRLPELPVTELLCQTVMQLPNGQQMALNDVNRVCETIRLIHTQRDYLSQLQGMPE